MTFTHTDTFLNIISHIIFMKTLPQYYSQKIKKWENLEASSLARFPLVRAVAGIRRQHFIKLHEKSVSSEKAVMELSKKNEIYTKIQSLPSLLSDLDDLSTLLQMNGLGTEHGYSCIGEQKDKVLYELNKIATSILETSPTPRDIQNKLDAQMPMIKYWITCYFTLSETFKSIDSAEERYSRVKTVFESFNKGVMGAFRTEQLRRHWNPHFLSEQDQHIESLRQRDCIMNQYLAVLKEMENISPLPPASTKKLDKKKN